jgi:8-oxo-dGTP diphosphatase
LHIVNVEAAILAGDRYLIIERGAEEAHAAGMLSFVGGKVDVDGGVADVLERTLRREIAEEVGVEVQGQIEYVESKSFVSDDGVPVVDIVFWCRYAGGTPMIHDPGEVTAIHWLTAAEILAHPRTPPWLRDSVGQVERRRAGGSRQ